MPTRSIILIVCVCLAPVATVGYRTSAQEKGRPAKKAGNSTGTKFGGRPSLEPRSIARPDDAARIASADEGPGSELFGRIALPEAWKARFWASSSAKALFALEPKAVADLVPIQAGVRFCRCPACDAEELDDPLTWSPEAPGVVRCRKCGITLPNDKFPAKEKDKASPPEETVEVLPGTFHRYPYHAVDPVKSRYPEERLYLNAKRDDLVRLYLSKAALYAAVKYRSQPVAARESRHALVSAAIILRFAQVYPAYAMHFDQPRPAQAIPAGETGAPLPERLSDRQVGLER